MLQVSSNFPNPNEALKKILMRINKRYGSLKLLQSVLMSKLLYFPKHTNRENVKLYYLLDSQKLNDSWQTQNTQLY